MVWLVADKYQQYLLVSQKLNWVKDYIDQHLASAPCDTVSISGLYSCAGSKDGRHVGFHKHQRDCQRLIRGEAFTYSQAWHKQGMG